MSRKFLLIVVREEFERRVLERIEIRFDSNKSNIDNRFRPTDRRRKTIDRNSKRFDWFPNELKKKTNLNEKIFFDKIYFSDESNGRERRREFVPDENYRENRRTFDFRRFVRFVRENSIWKREKKFRRKKSNSFFGLHRVENESNWFFERRRWTKFTFFEIFVRNFQEKTAKTIFNDI